MRLNRHHASVIDPLLFLIAVGALLPVALGRPAQGAPPASLAPAPVAPGIPVIVYAGRPLAGPDSALAPFRDPADNILCAAPDTFTPLGISFTTNQKAETVSFTGPDGAVATVRFRRASGGRVAVPVIEVIEALGGKCQWQTNTLHVRAVLTSVTLLGGQLRVKATLPVTATVAGVRATGKEPAKIIVDVAGAEVGSLPRQLSLSGPNIKAARSGQFNEDTARVVLELKEPGGLAPPDPRPSTLLVFNPTSAPAGSQRPSITVKIPPAPVSRRPRNKPKPPRPSQAPAVVSALTLRHVSDKKARIVIRAARAPQVRSALSRGRLTLDLLNTTLGANAASALSGARHPLLRAIRVLVPSASAARLVVDLTRVVAYTVSPQAKSGELFIDLSLPSGAGGRLAGKLVVIDAGHGAHDAGARGIIGIWEKNVNLAIALALRDRLQSDGVNVLLTRSDDTFVPLGERSYLANRSGADFFISIHADSAGNRSVSGSTIYYHKQIGSCRALAYTIYERLNGLNGIPSKGIRSDRVLYTNGLAVLRNSQMVSVLVECGYMTNLGDVTKLRQTATQQRIADAIADGLRDYVEGNPDLDTKNVNPRPTLPEEMVPPAAPEPPAFDTGEDAAQNLSAGE